MKAEMQKPLSDHLTGMNQMSTDHVPAAARKQSNAMTDNRARTSSTLQSEPVAVIGVACRFPSAPNPTAFWTLLRDGVDAVGKVPADRWISISGLTDRSGSLAHGAFLDSVADFDAAFFGVSPREASAIDPQQRLTLELVWEALEDSKIVPADLVGTTAAVYVGAMRDDYAELVHATGESVIGQHSNAGLHRGVIANRVSYVFGLRGASVVVDTAQSSSLVAVHMASEAVATGQAPLAIVAGFNLNILAESALAAERFGGLSPDGRCRTFDARANGFVRGEGGAAIVLKPLSTALADGDDIYAVIRGSAVNNDGATEALTVPSRTAQETVIRAAHERAGVRPDEVQYVELHGTGTPVGDPIEAAALSSAVASARTTPLAVGSVKTNIGHLEAAAGMAGLLKVVLAIRHRAIPGTLHFETANPKIPLSDLNLRVQTGYTGWPAADASLVAGVSSFGMGGTNCHIVVSEPPTDSPRDHPDAVERRSDLVAIPISARSSSALRDQAAALLGYTRSIADLGYAAAVTRTHFEQRAVIVAAERSTVDDGLSALVNGIPHPAVVVDTVQDAGVGVLFTGQGAQRVRMGADLAAHHPVFAEVFHRLIGKFDGLAEVIATGRDLDRTEFTQPALFSFEVAAYALVLSWGVSPEVLIGHSVGEVAAAHVAGVLSEVDACALVSARGKLMGMLPEGGAMVAVEAAEEAVADTLKDGVVIAAVNGRHSLVLSGPVDPILTAAETMRRRGTRVRRLGVSHAFHSPLMDPMLAEFGLVVASLTLNPPRIPIASTVTGQLVTTEMTTPEYWVRQVREPVRFLDAVAGLTVSTLLEIGPDAALTSMVPDCVMEGTDTRAIALQRSDRPEHDSAVMALARLHSRGADIDWATFYRGADPKPIALPTYSFQRERHWIDHVASTHPTKATRGSRQDSQSGTPTAHTASAQAVTAALVRAHVAAVLGITDPEAVPAHTPLRDLGFSSLMLTELRDALAGVVGQELPATILFDYPTTAALAEHLVSTGKPNDVDQNDGDKCRRPTETDSIAIVGMACRYPGDVSTPEDLWNLVFNRIDAVGPFPTDRGWSADLYDPDPDASGKSSVREGGFLTGVADFDPAFFGISPREALSMDPQQRLLLETAWEAIERSGVEPGALKGARTGVFIGGTSSDYGSRMHEAQPETEGHILTGLAPSLLSGRIAYQFGLSGPALTVDTACSSSLVALHLAVQSLRSGEVDTALAGGAAVMAAPGMFLEFSRQHGLSADARCKSFADGADGTVWAEGAGILALMRESDARRDGRPILAVIRGSAINNDGASNGLTAPSGAAQQRVIRRALADAGLNSDDVDVVEAHGTGTPLGDPIEAEALAAVYGQGRATPLLLGSLKSNTGHTQAAAGVGGVIKMVESMRRGIVPATLHADNPSSRVNWSSGAVELVTVNRPWPETGRVRRAGVSSFGISGTNAHLILEQATPFAIAAEPDSYPAPWVLSANSPASLEAMAGVLGDAISDIDGGAVAAALAARPRFEYRAAIVGRTPEERQAGLAELAEGHESAAVVRGSATTAARTAFIFTGQGSQRVGMGLELAKAFPVFAQAYGDAIAALDVQLDRPLWDVIAEGPDETLERTEYAQPALFAFEVAQARLLEAHGLDPDLVAGHSVGEYAAAHVAGLLDLEDAAQLVVTRGRLMQSAQTGGAMIAIAAAEHEVLPTLAEFDGRVTIAAVNGPSSVVVAGDAKAVRALAEQWSARGRRIHPLRVSHAFHSPHMDSALDEFRAAATNVRFLEPTVPMVSTVTGALADAVTLSTPNYWSDQIRAGVRFHDALLALSHAGATVFVEVGPDAVLTALASAALPGDATVFATARRGHSEPETVMRAVAGAYSRGASFALPSREPVSLPTYPFQRDRFWLSSRRRDIAERGVGPMAHPLLNNPVDLAEGNSVVFSSVLSIDEQPWLADHTIAGTLLVPGTALLELAAGAGRYVGSSSIEELTLERPLPMSTGADVHVQVTVSDEHVVTIHSRQGDTWVRHASGTLGEEPATGQPLTDWPPPGDPQAVDDIYDKLADLGYQYGPSFRGLTALWRDGNDTYAEVHLPKPLSSKSFGAHPALLDAVLHPLVLTAADQHGEVKLPFSWAGVRIIRPEVSAYRVKISLTGKDIATVVITDTMGAPVGTVESLSLRPVERSTLDGLVDSLFQLSWVAIPKPTPSGIPVSLLDAEGKTPFAAATSVLARATEWMKADHSPEERLIVRTRGAAADNTAVDLAGAAVWGLVRSLQSEHPDRFILLDSDGEDDVAEIVATGESQLVSRSGALHVPRLTKATPTVISPDLSKGTVLITGGTGGLGALLARHVVAEHGATDLVLVSRRGPEAPGALELIAELTALGATARAVAVDVTDRESLAGLIDEIPHLSAVVHTAGVLADGAATSLTDQQFADVLGPKADAALLLHELTLDRHLVAFILYSSVSGLVGTAGQANYAAANTVLDSLAAHRRAAGLPGTSLAWGLWDGNAGMGSALTSSDMARWTRSGFAPLETEHGLALFDSSLRTDAAVIAPIHWSPSTIDSIDIPTVLSGLARPARRNTGRPAGSAWVTSTAMLPESARVEAAHRLVRELTATALGHDTAATVDLTAAFKDQGFDSLAAVDLRNRLTSATGLRLNATAVFDYPSPRKLADHLLSLLVVNAPNEPTSIPNSHSINDPIAIVGMACRYPGGVDSPESLWQLVSDGIDATSEFPTNRGWDVDGLYDPDPDHIGTSYTRHGGFLHDADLFDADFFGLSPREATATDPQQRLLLETAWETFENAGIDPNALQGSRTGVYTGVMYDDYASRLNAAPAEYEGFLLAGNTSSVISGRLAYNYGLEGPAITVDTACSSSLVALHLAAQALRNGECDLALAGGVTVMSGPNTFVEFSRQRGLSPDGKCKSFSESADGTGWSEGVGLLLVERLSDAIARGHRVHGIVRGSAVNSDGASNGLTAPNGPSQERVIRDALAAAGLRTGDVDAVEAHGTGTRLGDPIEAQAIMATYGADRDANHPLLLGSLKSNIGHSQAAAGVGGVIKMLMAMRHGVLPRTLHVDSPSSQVDWDAGAVELLTTAREWTADRPLRAGVSSFGISGTNAHVILEAPEQEIRHENAARPRSRELLPWVLSARDADGLADQAVKLRAYVADRPELNVADIGFSLATTRAKLEHTALVLAADREQFINGLEHIAAGESSPSVFTGRRAGLGKIAFLFTGQGAQRVGMGRELYEKSTVFADALDEVLNHLDHRLGTSLLAILFAAEGDSDSKMLDQTLFTQAATFALEVALYRFVGHHGVQPDVVIGHSVGEIAAAHAAGILDLADACTLIVARGRAMQTARNDGAMMSLEASEAETVTELKKVVGVDVAAFNTPTSTVVSGDEHSVEAVGKHFREQGRRTTSLRVSHAFHSTHMDGILESFRADIADITFREQTIPVVSNVTGRIAESGLLQSANYWVEHVRSPVRFVDGVQTLETEGVTEFVELGPDAVLTGLVHGTTTRNAHSAVSLLRANRSETATALSALAALNTRGVHVDWSAALPQANSISLPTYAFRSKRYWLPEAASIRNTGRARDSTDNHPLLDTIVQLEGGSIVLISNLSLQRVPWLADHRIQGSTMLPGALLIELVLRAGEDLGLPSIGDLTIGAPVLLSADESVEVHVTASPDNGKVTVRSRDEDGAWTLHAEGTLVPTLDAIPLLVQADQKLEFDYDALTEYGYDYGPAFRGLRELHRGEQDLLAEVELSGPLRAEAAAFGVHPALLDAVLHPLLFLDDRPSVLPFSFSGITLHVAGVEAVKAHISVAVSGDGSLSAAVSLLGPSDVLVASIEALLLRPMLAVSAPSRGLHRLTWRELPHAPHSPQLPPVVVNPPTLSSVVGSPAYVALTIADDARSSVHSVLASVRNWLSESRFDESTLAIVTQGAQVESADPAGAAVWGLMRSAMTENPNRFVLVDLERASDTAALQTALASGEPEVAVRGDRVLVPRLATVVPESVDPDWHSGPVLVTGATGALGAVISRHLVTRHGVEELILLSRRGLSAPGAADLVDELTNHGAVVTVLACDASDRNALATALDGRTIGSIVHTAGVLADGLITTLTEDQVDKVLAPKIAAAWNLHELTLDRKLSAFVLYSSVAGLLGTSGQGNYAAGNSFLDALAVHRRGLGLPGSSLAWGLWADGSGMAGDLTDADLRRLARAGLPPLSTEEALSLFDLAVGGQNAVVSVARLDLATLRSQDGPRPAVLRDLVPERVVRAHASTLAVAGVSKNMHSALIELSDTDRATALHDLVVAETANVLGYGDPDEVAPDRGFSELGFDSLTSVELRNRLGTATGLRLPSTMVFDHPSPDSIATYLYTLFHKPSGPSLMEELDRLATLITKSAGVEIGSAAPRLRELAMLAETTATSPPPRASADELSDDDLDTASDEELFAMLNELD